MPELAEVEFYRRKWDAGKGEKITAVDLHPKARPLKGIDAEALVKALRGAKFTSSSRHGKQMFFHFGPGKDGSALALHLGMTGHLSVRKADAPQEKHDHLVLRQAERSLVFTDFRMFGKVCFMTGREALDWERELPPEVPSPAFTKKLCLELLQRRARTPVKAALLDQEAFPGIGNWMADEVLWQARIAPSRLAGKLSDKEAAAVYTKLRSVCAGALKTVATVKGEDFGDPPSSWLFARRWKKGGKCPRCGTGLRHGTIRGRTACWCPTCQPK